jgi:hypothetical protein
LRPVLPWIVAYLVILLVWALIIVRRPGPTLWKGRSLVALNIAFMLVSTGAALWGGRTMSDGQGGSYWCCVPPGLIVFDVVLIVAALVMREKWFLFGITHDDTVVALQRCFTQTRATSVRRGDAYAIQCGGVEMQVTVRPTISRMMTVRFTGGAGSRKAVLVRNLFCKHFHNSFPTPRFRA